MPSELNHSEEILFVKVLGLIVCEIFFPSSRILKFLYSPDVAIDKYLLSKLLITSSNRLLSKSFIESVILMVSYCIGICHPVLFTKNYLIHE